MARDRGEKRAADWHARWCLRVPALMHQRTGNTLYALDAYTQDRGSGREIPSWVLRVLDSVSDQARGVEESRPARRGARAPESEYSRFYRELNVVLEDMLPRLRDGTAIGRAAEDAAQAHANSLRGSGLKPREAKFFERAWRRLDPILEQAAKDVGESDAR